MRDWVYSFGPTFEAHGDCFDVDGTFAITLRSGARTISGPPPFVEDDTVELTSGTALFHTMSAGARFKGMFQGTVRG